MSIMDTISSIENNLSAAYTAIDTKGGTIPTYKNIENLADAITSISGGGSSGLTIKQMMDEYTGEVQIGAIPYLGTLTSGTAFYTNQSVDYKGFIFGLVPEDNSEFIEIDASQTYAPTTYAKADGSKLANYLQQYIAISNI